MEVVEEGGEEENAAGRTRLKRFYFADEEDDDDDAALLVTIPEVLDPHYGMYVWPCSVVLAQFVWHNRALVRDQLVLELGAGTALPGIVAARCGATVTLSDLPRCLPSCAHSCRVNGLDGSVPVLGLRWGLVTPSLVTMPPLDIILGSDILYEPRARSGVWNPCSSNGASGAAWLSRPPSAATRPPWPGRRCLETTRCTCASSRVSSRTIPPSGT
ncbi:histone-arginine methyltransferase METTL23 isoform X3 [Lampetra fluviatilis]